MEKSIDWKIIATGKMRTEYTRAKVRRLIFQFILLPITKTKGDFTYLDFNSTAGLAFNGAAHVTNCGESIDPTRSHKVQVGHTATLELSTYVETTYHSSLNDDIALHVGVFGHRHDFDIGPNTLCSNRIRLTPSNPSKAGSVWYETRVPVFKGFETTFSWTITDHSKECTRHTDRDFAQYEHESCAVHGGDGFAFVIHGDPADASALGRDGDQLGYGGISNSSEIGLLMMLTLSL